MTTESDLSEKLLDILEIARYAPSVHNAQPWRVSLDGDKIIVRIDEAQKLTFSDPTGRETIISLGIFCEALSISASSVGLQAKQSELTDAGAAVSFKAGKAKAQDSEIAALRGRCTDRSIFKPVEITSGQQKQIESSSDFTGVSVKVVTERQAIDKMAHWTAKGIGLALSNPEFRKELSGYLALPWGNHKRGISVRALYLPLPLALAEPKFIRWGIGLKTEVRTERRRWQSASGIILITTPGDVKNDWFKAGRAYLRASLEVEKLGLAQATSAATVEASTFHEDVEEMLGTDQRLQATIRLGRVNHKPRYSPRLSAEELMAT